FVILHFAFTVFLSSPSTLSAKLTFLFLLLLRRPPGATLFPYTTLFRSGRADTNRVMSEPSHFRLCTTCKTPIPFSAKYYACSVSTCNRKATAMYFCSVPCWDAHVPEARHRDAWAEVETAPSREEWLRE